MENRESSSSAFSRRDFLRVAAIAGAGTVAVGAGAGASALAEEAADAEQDVDAVSTATMTSLQGVALMTNAEVKEHIAGLLVGVHNDYREIYTLGTCVDNVPLTSCMEYVFDPEGMVFVGMCDAGTKKLLEVQANPNVSLSWCHMLTPEEAEAGNNYFSISKGIQASGTATLVTGDDEDFGTYMLPYLETISEMMPATEDSLAMLAGIGATCIVVAPDTITVRDMEFKQGGYSYMQIWRAGTADDAIEEGGLTLEEASAETPAEGDAAAEGETPAE